MSDITLRTNKFDKCISKKFTDTEIYNKVHDASNPSYNRIFKKYQSYLKEFAPRLINP